jgi:hypothetical protein
VIKFKSDNRLFIAMLILGILLIVLGCVALKPYQTSVYTYLWLLPGLLFITLAFLKREVLTIDNGYLVIRNRLNILPKNIRLDDIKKVNAIEEENNLPGINQSILHLLLWDKKFKRIKDIEVFGAKNIKLFTIDGRALENLAYVQLIRLLKNKK